jgi:hypothetical protein
VGYKLTEDKVELTLDIRFVPPAGPGFQFFYVPWPPPASGPVVLALFLFALGTDQRPNHGCIEYGRLYALLGIPKRDARRALDRAVITVNKHLEKLNKGGLLDEEGLPTKIDLVPSRGGRFVHIELSGTKYAQEKAKPDGERRIARAKALAVADEDIADKDAA